MSAFSPQLDVTEQPDPAPLPSTGFWPGIDFEELRAAVRIDPAVTPARIRDSAIAARLDIAKELDTWRQVQVAAGYAKLEDVPNKRGPQLADEGLVWSVALFNRAVASQVAADHGDRTRDAGTTLAGSDRADELESAVDIHRRNFRHALSDLQGRPRSTIELL